MGDEAGNSQDFLVVTHVGRILASGDGLDGHLVLPDAGGVRGTRLAQLVHDELEAPADVQEPTEVDGRTYQCVAIQPMAVPNVREGRLWVSADEAGSLDWQPDCERIVRRLLPSLLQGAPLGNSPVSPIRIGGTVRRPVGNWTAAVHAGLGHLEKFGLDAIPKVIGFDQLGREVLSYLPGRRVPTHSQFLTDVQLAEVASWTLRMHEALRDFQHPGPFRAPTPEGATMFGHGNLVQNNLCFAGNRLVGVVDWDLLGPTTAPRELAWLAWATVPLGGFLRPPLTAKRLLVLATTYDIDPVTVLDTVESSVKSRIDSIRQGASLGDPGFVSRAERGEPERLEARLATHLRSEREEMLALLAEYTRSAPSSW